MQILTSKYSTQGMDGSVRQVNLGCVLWCHLPGNDPEGLCSDADNLESHKTGMDPIVSV